MPTGFSSVPEHWWRDRFYQSAAPGADDEAKRKAIEAAERSSVDLLGMSAA